MTDALTRLADAVESGAGHFDILSAATEWDSDNGNGLSECVVNAFHGSLDAAKALHDAVLPGWGWSVEATSNACVWRPDTFGVSRDIEISTTAARAWLIAIIRALAQVAT